MWDTLSASAETLGAAGTQAEWFPIRICHDTFTGELLNLGVAVRDNSGALQVRVLDELGRLTCLYGEDEANSILLAARVAAEQLYSGSLISPSRNIIFGTALPIYGQSLSQIVYQLYGQTVSLARPQRSRQEKYSGKQPDRHDIQAQVFEAMQLKAGTRADQVIAQNPSLEVRHGGQVRKLHIPLQTRTLMGRLESAWYKSKSTLEVKLLNATLDMETAAAQYKTGMGLFIVRPAEDTKFMSEAQHRIIDDVIDTISWKLLAQGARVEIESNANTLAEKILDWAGV